MLRLAWRLWRRSAQGAPAAVVALAALLTTFGFLALSVASPSPEQVRQQDFGDYDYSAGFGLIRFGPGDAEVVERVAASMAEAGVASFATSITSPEVPIASMPGGTARLQEADWTDPALPGVFGDLVGRWAERPGEVVVSGSSGTRVGDRLEVAGGSTTWLVVGTVDDRYTTQPAVLAAPGTWETLPRSLASTYDVLRGQATIYWSGRDTARGVDAIAGVIPASRRAVDATTGSVAEIEDRGTDWFDRLPIGFTVPSTLLPAAAVAVAYGVTERRRRRLRVIGDAVGVPRRTLVGAHGLALGVSCVAACVVGVALAWPTAVLLTPLIESVLDRPIDLAVSLWEPGARLLLVTALCCVIASIALSRTRAKPRSPQRSAVDTGTPPSSRRRPGRWTMTGHEIRRLAAILAVCAGVVQVPLIADPAATVVAAATFSAAVVLLVPDALALCVRWLPRYGWRSRLAGRRIGAEPLRSSALVTVVASSLAMAIGFLVLLDSLVASSDSDRLPDVAPGQVLVQDRASQLFDPDRRTVRAVTEAADRQPLRLTWAIDVADNGDLRRDTNVEGTLGTVLIVESEADAARVLGRETTTEELATLGGGGIVAWPGDPELGLEAGESASRPLLASGARGSREIAQVAVTVAGDTRLASWQRRSSGMLLASTARQLDLPRTTGAVLFTGLNDTSLQSVTEAASAAGVDPSTVVSYKPPEPLVPPGITSLIGAGLIVVVFVLAVAATWSDARTLDGLRRLLLALGLSPHSIRGVVALQQTLLTLLALLLGLLMAGPALLLARATGVILVVELPVGQVLLIVGALLLASVSAGVFGIWRATTARPPSAGY